MVYLWVWLGPCRQTRAQYRLGRGTCHAPHTGDGTNASAGRMTEFREVELNVRVSRESPAGGISGGSIADCDDWMRSH